MKNNIAPAAPGRIRQIFVEVGTTVSKGQRLAQMDVANLSNSETQIENTRRMYKRVSELFSVGGASQQELDNAKLQLDVAEINLKNLNENTFLLSPINGVVTARNYDAGDMYSGQMTILTVMQINPVKLRINISESYYTKVKVGMPVKVNVEVFGDESFNGKVSLIYPTIDERTRTFPIEIKLSNNNSKIRPGMFARVNINFGTMKHVVVPDRAVIKQSGSAARFVYIYKDGKVSYKQVEIGQRIDNEYELISGVDNGAQWKL
jgi:RND family efflux transporter MFP subunit